MDSRNKLIELILESLEKSDFSCEICTKMGFKCNVEIPDNADIEFKPDFSKCDFKAEVFKTLTTQD